jgi:bifunctional DNA-binding transcriptional regulator/antitoxin component of YhaV-PrlF toxin-antitoxin module
MGSTPIIPILDGKVSRIFKEDTMILEVDEEGRITLPEEIIERFHVKAGDFVHFSINDNGTITMTFPKKEEIEIDMPDEEIYTLMKMAHERDITLNQLVEDILRKECNKHPNKVSVATFEENFDYIVDQVEKGAVYYIYEDQEFTKELCAFIPYSRYEEITSWVKK